MTLFARDGLLERMIDRLPGSWGLAGLVLCVLLFLPFSIGRAMRGKW